MILVFTFLLFSLSNVASISPTATNISRRIGDKLNKATEYPRYVVGLGWWNPIISGYEHMCMGTLITQTWLITTKDCVAYAFFIVFKKIIIFFAITET